MRCLSHQLIVPRESPWGPYTERTRQDKLQKELRKDAEEGDKEVDDWQVRRLLSLILLALCAGIVSPLLL